MAIWKLLLTRLFSRQEPLSHKVAYLGLGCREGMVI
jgi:hypothetical protein